MKAPQEQAQAKHDNSAQRLLLNMKTFSELLEAVNNNFPAIIKDASKWDVLGKAARKWSKMGDGRANIDLLKSHYLELATLFETLSFDVNIYRELPQAEDSEDTRLGKMGRLSGNQESFNTLLRVFSTTALLGLARHNIRPLIDSLERQRHIATSPKFRKALDELDGFLNEFFSANHGQNNATVEEIQNAELIHLAEQFEPMARLCRCIVNFAVISDAKSQEKFKQPISGIQAAAALAEPVFLLGEFTQLFGLDTLGQLLVDHKAWLERKQDSLKVLQQRLATLFIQRAEQLLGTYPAGVHPVADVPWFYFQSTQFAFLNMVLTDIQKYMSGEIGPFSHLQASLKTSQILMEKQLAIISDAYLMAERNQASDNQDAAPEGLDLALPVDNDNNRVEVVEDDSALQWVPERVMGDELEANPALQDGFAVSMQELFSPANVRMRVSLANIMQEHNADALDFSPEAMAPSVNIDRSVVECTFELGETVTATEVIPTATSELGEEASFDAGHRSPQALTGLKGRVAFFEQEQARAASIVISTNKPLADLPPVAGVSSSTSPPL